MKVIDAIKKTEENHDIKIIDFSANDAPFLIPITCLSKYFEDEVSELDDGLEYYIKRIRCKISFLPF